MYARITALIGDGASDPINAHIVPMHPPAAIRVIGEALENVTFEESVEFVVSDITGEFAEQTGDIHTRGPGAFACRWRIAFIPMVCLPFRPDSTLLTPTARTPDVHRLLA